MDISCAPRTDDDSPLPEETLVFEEEGEEEDRELDRPEADVDDGENEKGDENDRDAEIEMMGNKQQSEENEDGKKRMDVEVSDEEEEEEEGVRKIAAVGGLVVLDPNGREWITVKGSERLVLKPPAPQCRKKEEKVQKDGGGEKEREIAGEGEKEREGEGGGEKEGEGKGRVWRSSTDPGWKEFRDQVDWRRGDDGQFEWSLDQKAVEEEVWRRKKGWGGGRSGGWSGGRGGGKSSGWSGGRGGGKSSGWRGGRGGGGGSEKVREFVKVLKPLPKKPAPKPRPTTVSDVGETKRTEKEKTNDEGKKRQDEENRGNEEEKKRHDAEKKRHDAMKRTVETAKDAEKKGNDEAEKNGGKRTREEIHDSDGSGDSGDEEDESPKVLAVEGDAKVVKSEDGFLG